MTYTLRLANSSDVLDIAGLITRSAKAIDNAYYSAAEVDAALTGAFGVDEQLIADSTYWIVHHNGLLVGCGGWSYRRTLFGSSARKERDDTRLDPLTEAAKIRAFFVDPSHLRKGIAKSILETCERAAQAAGFTQLQLMATLSGVPFYRQCGYQPSAPMIYAATPNVDIRFVPMRKELK